MNDWFICWFFMHPLNAEFNPICHLLALLGGATIVVVSRVRVNHREWPDTHCTGGWVVPGLPLNGCGKYNPNWNSITQLSSPVASRYTDCCTPVHVKSE